VADFISDQSHAINQTQASAPAETVFKTQRSVLSSYTKFDYCKCTVCISQANTDRLEHVQNVLARLVAEAPWTIRSVNIHAIWLPETH